MKRSLLCLIPTFLATIFLATSCIDVDNHSDDFLELDDLMTIEDWCRNADSCGMLKIQDYRCMNNLRNELVDISTDNSMSEACRLLFIELPLKTYECQNDLYAKYSCDAFQSESRIPADVKSQIDSCVEPVSSALISSGCVKQRQ